jgi:hypothetical protein
MLLKKLDDFQRTIWSCTQKTELFILLPVFSFGTVTHMCSISFHSSVKYYSLITTVNPFVH